MQKEPSRDDLQPTADADERAGRGVLMSIGALSRATGVPVSTLRTWERRYGFPSPERLPSGHRRYRSTAVGRLRLVAQALEQGHRASSVLGEPAEALRRRLALAQPVGSDASSAFVAACLTCAAAFDVEGLEAALLRAAGEHGTLAFLEHRLAPLVVALGEAWADGRLAVAQEHAAAERLGRVLVGIWGPLSDRQQGPEVVCACLPGERHTLGLHMAAVCAAVAGGRVRFVGADTPLVDIVLAAQGARAVLVSVSSAAQRGAVAGQLTTLRAALPAAVELVIGGAGAPETAGTLRPGTFSELVAMLRNLFNVPSD